MSKPEQVHRYLLQQAPAAVCDDCVAEHSGVQPRNQVNPITRTLGLTSDFQRAKGQCALCKEKPKFVTWAVCSTAGAIEGEGAAQTS